MRSFLAAPALILTICITACLPAKEAAPAEKASSPSQGDTIESLATRIDQALVRGVLQWQSEMVKRKLPIESFSLLGPAADADFVRRAYLDAIGRIPTAEEALQFIDDFALDKRTRLIDRLMADQAWSEQHFHRLADMFRVTDRVAGSSQQPYIDWLKSTAHENLPLDKLVRSLLTASGTIEENPATGFLLRDGGPMYGIASSTALIFLGCDLHCAACHDHAFDDWTQMQFYQWAACLGATVVSENSVQPRVEIQKAPVAGGGYLRTADGRPVFKRDQQPVAMTTLAKVSDAIWPAAMRQAQPVHLKAGEQLAIGDISHPALTVPPTYLYRDAKPGDAVQPAFLAYQKLSGNDKPPAENTAAKPAAIREAWAEWIIRQPRFAETMALRLWEQLFGFPSTVGFGIGWEPEAEPQPMAASLANGCCDNRAGVSYACSFLNDNNVRAPFPTLLGQVLRETGFDARKFQHILMRTDAYQRAALVSVSRGYGYPPEIQPQPRMRRMTAEQAWDSISRLADSSEMPKAISLPQALSYTHPLRILGRGAREWTDDSAPAISYALTRWMLNSDQVRHAAENVAQKNPGIEPLFLAVLSRRPFVGEIQAARRHLEAHPGDLTSIAHSLICTGEFLFTR